MTIMSQWPLAAFLVSLLALPYWGFVTSVLVTFGPADSAAGVCVVYPRLTSLSLASCTNREDREKIALEPRLGFGSDHNTRHSPSPFPDTDGEPHRGDEGSVTNILPAASLSLLQKRLYIKVGIGGPHPAPHCFPSLLPGNQSACPPAPTLKRPHPQKRSPLQSCAP